MNLRISHIFATALLCLVGTIPAWAGILPCVMPVGVYEVLANSGDRIATAVVTTEAGLGYRSDFEYWRFSAEALNELSSQDSIQIHLLAEGDWRDPWVLDALDWLPEDPVEWSHSSSEVAWTPQAESPAPIPEDATFFADPTIGGLVVHTGPRGSSLTWIKLTEGDDLAIPGRAAFESLENMPSTGAWWQHSISH